MKVGIASEPVLHGAMALSAARESLPTGSVAAVADVGDPVIEGAGAALQDWWTAMCRGTVDDIGRLHHIVTSAVAAQVARDQHAVADIEKTSAAVAAARAV